MMVVMILLRALVDALHKDVVQLLCHRDLRVLQLGKRVHHYSIVVVLAYHSLQKGEVIRRELTDALVQSDCNLLVGSDLTINNLLDVVLALCHVLTELGQVAQHQLFIWKELLVLHEVTDFAFAHMVRVTWSLGEDGKSVEMLLSVKEHIEPTSLEFIHSKGMG